MIALVAGGTRNCRHGQLSEFVIIASTNLTHLFSCKFENGGERSVLWDTKPEQKNWVIHYMFSAWFPDRPTTNDSDWQRFA